MNSTRTKILLVLPGLVFVMAVALIPRGGARQPGRVQETTVLAAASLNDVMQPLGDKFGRRSGIGVRLDFASSGLLRKKIEAGARADVFLSASPEEVDSLQGGGHVVPATRRAFLRNSLVCVLPRPLGSPIARPADLLHPAVRRVAIGDPAHVPAGLHAKQALTHFGLLDALEGKLVPCADARAALVQAEMETVDAALVYLTDAMVSSKVRIAFSFPEESYAPITYEASILRTAHDIQAAQAFLGFITSAEAQPVYARHGFLPVSGFAR